MPKHILRLLLILVAGSLLAYAGKAYLTDPSFYRFGHYRGDAVTEIAAQKPVIQGAGKCIECHEKRQHDWAVGSHHTVQCEICHGMHTEGHPDNGVSLVPKDTIRLCTQCHEAMPSRPAGQPQIVVGEHPFPGEEKTPCISCHDPHLPGGGQAEAPRPDSGAETAAVPAAVSKCAKCHGARGEGHGKNPPLAGKPVSELVQRLQMYKSGELNNKIMNKYAGALSDEEIEQIAAYYAALPAPAPQE